MSCWWWRYDIKSAYFHTPEIKVQWCLTTTRCKAYKWMRSLPVRADSVFIQTALVGKLTRSNACSGRHSECNFPAKREKKTTGGFTNTSLIGASWLTKGTGSRDRFRTAVVNEPDNLDAGKRDVCSFKDFHVADDKSLYAPRVSLHSIWSLA